MWRHENNGETVFVLMMPEKLQFGSFPGIEYIPDKISRCYNVAKCSHFLWLWCYMGFVLRKSDSIL